MFLNTCTLRVAIEHEVFGKIPKFHFKSFHDDALAATYGRSPPVPKQGLKKALRKEAYLKKKSE